MEAPENPRRSIDAAFDSVDLISKTIQSTGTTLEIKLDIVKRNKEHLEIMMGKEWFINALINDEGNRIQTSISNAQNFINSNA